MGICMQPPLPHESQPCGPFPRDTVKMQARVKRIAGQVAGIQRMVDDGRYCVEILHQISSVRSALDGLGVELLNHHLEGCILGHGSGQEHERAKPMSREELLVELKTALTQFMR